MSVINPVFSRILSASQIEDQAEQSLKTWFPTYLREMERQLDLPKSTFPAPENYTDRNKLQMESPEKLPKVVIIAPGTVTTPIKRSGWVYNATWRLGIGIAVGARTESDASLHVKTYAAAIRAIMLQNSGMDNLNAVDIEWTEEIYDDLPVSLPNQLVKAASLNFDIEFTDVTTRGHGPLTPDEATYSYGEAQTVDVEITNLGTEEVTD